MDTIQTGFTDLFQCLHGFTDNGSGSGISGHPFNLRKLLFQKPQNRHQILCFHDQVIGILQKTGIRLIIQPGSNRAILAGDGLIEDGADHSIIDSAVVPQFS